MKAGAILIGGIFGGFFLLIFLSEGLDRGVGPVSIPAALALVTGPLTLVLATVVGLKYERLAGYWLLASGVVTAVVLAIGHIGLPMLFAVSVFIIFPMWVEGVLWLKYSSSLTPR